MITLYDCATAPSPRRARIFLAEKGVPHATVQVDLGSGEQLGEAFRRVNPQCTVPALVTEEGPVLTDNAAIAAYLEARFPEPPLLGRTPLEKAEIAGWQSRIEFEGLMAIAEAFRNSSPAMANRALTGPVDYAQIPELAERGLARVRRFVVMLDEHLAGRDFIAAGQFSLADITAVVAVDFARVVKVKPGDEHPHLRRWRGPCRRAGRWRSAQAGAATRPQPPWLRRLRQAWNVHFRTGRFALDAEPGFLVSLPPRFTWKHPSAAWHAFASALLHPASSQPSFRSLGLAR